MDDVWLRGIMVGAAGVLAVFSLVGGALALLTRRAQPGADLLAGQSGSVSSRGRRALVLGVLWSVVVVLAAGLARPFLGQIAFWVALAAGWLVRGVYDRQVGRQRSSAAVTPRTASDSAELQQPPASSDRTSDVKPPA